MSSGDHSKNLTRTGDERESEEEDAENDRATKAKGEQKLPWRFWSERESGKIRRVISRKTNGRWKMKEENFEAFDRIEILKGFKIKEENWLVIKPCFVVVLLLLLTFHLIEDSIRARNETWIVWFPFEENKFRSINSSLMWILDFVFLFALLWLLTLVNGADAR
jgi:hypothetical protein